jgi:PAS domain S-box-containing protein
MVRGASIGPVMIHSVDTIRYVNDAFCRLVGVDSAATVTGCSPDEFVVEPDHEPLADHFDRLRHDDTAVNGVSVELKRLDGSRIDAATVSSPVAWDGETLIQTSVMTADDARRGRPMSLQETAAHESPIGVTIADVTVGDDPLIYVNDAFVELTGYTREEAVGRNCRFLQGEDTRSEPVAEIRAAIREERPTTVELRNYRKDGSLFWNRVTVSPIRDGTGTVTHFLGFQEDVSDAKLNEQEKALFEATTEMSDQVMFITDTEWQIEYVNPAFERITGYTAAEAIGETPRILRSEAQDDVFYDQMWETITSGETWEATLTNRTKSGEQYQCRQRIVPITDDRGKLTHFAAIETDITEKQLTDQILGVLNRILRHNVRTAVNVIEGYTDLLESGVNGAEERAAIRTIRERATALNDISERTATLRSLLADDAELSSLGLSELTILVDGYRAEYDDAAIDLTIEVSDDIAIRNGDALRIAFEEIIKNAVAHTDQEHPHVDITVEQSSTDTTLDIVIADDGPGIPTQEWEIIKNGTETPLRHANSIGLWLIYWSVTALGGSVQLSDNDPRGSVFTLQVPTVAESKEGQPPSPSYGRHL